MEGGGEAIEFYKTTRRDHEGKKKKIQEDYCRPRATVAYICFDTRGVCGLRLILCPELLRWLFHENRILRNFLPASLCSATRGQCFCCVLPVCLRSLYFLKDVRYAPSRVQLNKLTAEWLRWNSMYGFLTSMGRGVMLPYFAGSNVGHPQGTSRQSSRRTEGHTHEDLFPCRHLYYLQYIPFVSLASIEDFGGECGRSSRRKGG